MKLLVMVEEGSVNRVRKAIDKLAEFSQLKDSGRDISISTDLRLDEAVQQLVCSVLDLFEIIHKPPRRRKSFTT